MACVNEEQMMESVFGYIFYIRHPSIRGICNKHIGRPGGLGRGQEAALDGKIQFGKLS